MARRLLFFLALLVGAISMFALGMVGAVFHDIVPVSRFEPQPVATISLDLADQVERLQEERSRLSSALAENVRQLTELERRLADAGPPAVPSNGAPAEAEAVRRLETALKEARERNVDLASRLAALKAAAGVADERATTDAGAITALRRELADVVRERDVLQGKLGAENARLREQLDRKDRDIEALRQRIAALEQRSADAPAVAPPPPPQPAARDAQAGSANVVQGIAAYQAGNYADAYRIWRPLAESGVARAQFHLGALYYEGRGVTRDLALARQWLSRALSNGYTAAGDLLVKVENEAAAAAAR